MIAQSVILDSTFLNDLSESDLESLLRRKKEDMSRKEILGKYPVKQLPQPDGRWWVRIEGKQYFRKTREELENLILELNKVSELTICAIFNEYLEQRKLQVASSTWVIDKKYFDTYITGSKLGKKPIKELTIDDGYVFFDYVKTIKPDIKEKYWRNLKSSLDMIIKYCIQKRYIEGNPFEFLLLHQKNFAPKKETEDKDTVYSEEEKTRVCELAEMDAIETGMGIPLGIVLLFNTGLRIGELIASRWSDVVYIEEKPHLYIRRIQVGSVDNEGNIRGRETADRCKSKRSKRKVPLNSKSVEILDKIKEYNEEYGFPTGKQDYIFYRMVNGDICECTERCFAGRLAKYCREAGMKVNKSPHDIRRTALTDLWLNGVPIKIIQLIAGHNTQKQTEEYLRITELDILDKNYMESLVKNKFNENQNKPNRSENVLNSVAKVGDFSGKAVRLGGQSNIVQFQRR